MSLRAYARRRGVSAPAVSKAIKTGRLRESVTHAGGKVAIADPELADLEWEMNTAPRSDGTGGDLSGLIAVRVRKETAQAELAELKLAEVRGELVPVGAVAPRFYKFSTALRSIMLGTPSDARQHLPERFTEDDVADALAAFDRAVRDGLERGARAAEAGEL